jgi:hypothetical protein
MADPVNRDRRDAALREKPPNLIWNDPVKPARSTTLGSSSSMLLSDLLDIVGHAASEVAEAAIATVDHSDIRGSTPHNRDPSGAASD